MASLVAWLSCPSRAPTIKRRMSSSLSFFRRRLSAARAATASSGRLDDFGHGDSQPALDENDLAAGDQAVVDKDVDGFTDLAVELDHSAHVHAQQVGDRHARAAENHRKPHGHVEHGLEVLGGLLS